MKKILFISAALLSLCSCTKKENEVSKPLSEEQELSEIHKDTMLTLHDNDTLKIDLNSALHTITFNKEARAGYVLKVTSTTPTTALLHLKTEDTLANIRFSQITTPSNISDGPFGSALDYDFKEKGVYYIRINENSMAGDPWSGKVILSVGKK